jgi:hypothetical protein
VEGKLGVSGRMGDSSQEGEVDPRAARMELPELERRWFFIWRWEVRGRVGGKYGTGRTSRRTLSIVTGYILTSVTGIFSKRES